MTGCGKWFAGCHGDYMQMQAVMVITCRCRLSWWLHADAGCHGDHMQMQAVMVITCRCRLSRWSHADTFIRHKTWLCYLNVFLFLLVINQSQTVRVQRIFKSKVRCIIFIQAALFTFVRDSLLDSTVWCSHTAACVPICFICLSNCQFWLPCPW